jgi:hypothetical protein
MTKIKKMMIRVAIEGVKIAIKKLWEAIRYDGESISINVGKDKGNIVDSGSNYTGIPRE